MLDSNQCSITNAKACAGYDEFLQQKAGRDCPPPQEDVLPDISQGRIYSRAIGAQVQDQPAANEYYVTASRERSCMKLTERQIRIRSVFRNHIIDNWYSKERCKMFGAIIAVADDLEIKQYQAKDEMLAIPSIGWIGDTMTINVWMAKYFRPVSDALFNNAPKEKVLLLWSKTKKTASVSPKLSVTDKKEHAQINKNHKKLAAFAELHKNMPDRWGKTAWNKVK